jgi:hypothetical protein
MNESEGVCQFVNSHLGDPFVEGIEADPSPALSLPKAIERNHRRPSSQLGLAKDVGEHGNEQVHIHHAHQTLMGPAALGKPLENTGGIILLAPVVQGKIRVTPAGKDVYGEVEHGLEVSGNDSHNRISPGTQGNNPDRPVSRRRHVVSVGKALVDSRPRLSAKPSVNLSVTQTVSFDLLVEGNPVDLESLCCPADIPVKFLKYSFEVGDFTVSQGARSASRRY